MEKNTKTNNFKIISIILILSILIQFVLPIMSNAAALTVSLKSDCTQLKTGDEINIQIYVTGGATSYFDGYLNFDTNVFETITKNNIYINSNLLSDDGHGFWMKTVAASGSNEYKISISESSGDPYEIPDDGLIGTLKLKVKQDTDTTKVIINNVSLVNESGDDETIAKVSIDLPSVVIKTYTVTYNPNTTDNVTNMPATATKVGGESYLIAGTPSREGYKFKEWNTSSDGTGTSYKVGDAYNTDTNLNLYAQWEAITSTLTVNPNGGTWNGSSNTQPFTANYGTKKTIANPSKAPNGYIVKFNSNGGNTSVLQEIQPTSFDNWTLTGGGTFNNNSIYTFADTDGILTANYTGGTITLPSVTKTGATFKGWFTAATGGTRVGGIGDQYLPTSATTLSAQWNEVEYTLTVNPNGGTWNGSSNSQTINGKYTNQKPVTDPIAPNGYTVTLDDDGTTSQLKQTKNFDKWILTGKGNISGIVYTFGDGDGQLTATYTVNSVELPTPTKAGYTFDGWYTQKSGGTKVNSPYMPSSDITLYAHWTANQYTITFDPGTNGTVGTTTKQVTYDQTYGTLPTPTRPGGRFDGWYTEDGTKVTSTDKVNITKDTKLTAKWIEVSSKLTVNPNGGTWSGKTNSQDFTQNYNTTKNIENPTAPNGYTVKFDANGGNATQTQLVQPKTFDKWTLTGAGSLTGTTYTFGDKDGTLTANYKDGNVTLPSATKTGATFKGWYTAKTTGTKVGDAGTIYNALSDVTLYAQWEEQKYTLTIDPNGGTIGGNTNKKTVQGGYNSTTEIETPVTPTKYKVTLDNDGQTTDIIQTTTFTGWKVKSGSGTISNSTYTFGTDDGEITATYTENTVDLPTLTKAGYKFDGWYTQKTGGTKVDTPYMPTSDITLYAHWTAEKSKLTVNPNGGTWDENTNAQDFTQDINTTKEIENPIAPNGYTVKFDANGGNATQTQLVQSKTFDKWTLTGAGSFAGTTYTFGDKDGTLTANYKDGNITLPSATKSGATFKGWYTAKTDGTKVGDAGTIYNATSDVTLYAQWEEQKYTLTIDPNGGTIGGSTDKKTEQGGYNSTTEVETPTAPTKYKVTLDNDGQTTDIMQTTTFAGWQVKSGSGTISNSTYTFGTDNGEITATYTENPVDLTTPTKAGYKFDGWYTQKTGGTKVDIPYMPTSDTTLYAHWTAEEYTITFNPGDGATVDTQTKKVTYDQPYGELPTPTKEGSTFIGWFDSNDNKIESTTTVKTTGDTTLTAKYEVNKYKVTYKNDDGTTISTETVEYGKDAQNSGNEPEKSNVPAGYEAKFIGWNNEKDLKNIKSDVIVTAKYEVNPIEYNITYENIKGSDNSANPTTYTVEDGTIKLADLPNQKHYSFKGWYTAPDSTGTKVESIDTSKLGNIKVYAQWDYDGLYLSSKTYKIGENDIDNYEEGDIYLDKISPETTVSEFIDNCSTNGKITIYDAQGKALRNNDLVGTGMTIKVTRDDEEIDITAVVMGDIDGDGRTTIQDLSELNKAYLGISEKELEGARFKAADIDDSTRITATDFSELNKAILGIQKLTYKKNK